MDVINLIDELDEIVYVSSLDTYELLYIKISSIINYLDCYFDILYNITKADIKRQKGQFFYIKKKC